MHVLAEVDPALWAGALNFRFLDVLVLLRCDKEAEKCFFRKLLKELRYVPRVLVTDKLKSYCAAKAQIMPGVEHRQHKGLNNRAEVSHQPNLQRERQMRRFKSLGHAQRFAPAHGPFNNPFCCQHDRLPAA